MKVSGGDSESYFSKFQYCFYRPDLHLMAMGSVRMTVGTYMTNYALVLLQRFHLD